MSINLDWEPRSQNYYSKLVQGQRFALLPSFTLESGCELRSVPVAYKTWGTLNEERDNVIVLCHALTGSSDAEDWWRPLMGPGKTFDYLKFFIFCANVLGSPYGSASPLTTNPETGKIYGTQFPATSIRDDVRIQKEILDAIGVSSVAAVVGGSMGGMLVLEWPLCVPNGYVKQIVPITTSAFHSAWGISWGETQRQCIYADWNYRNGQYEPVPNGQPIKGMGTARMVAMLTYRSHVSFECRFGRKKSAGRKKIHIPTPPPSDDDEAALESCRESERLAQQPKRKPERREPLLTPEFSAQSYLQYQADKFLTRFDANCYIHLTNKMDSHDVTRNRMIDHTEGKYSPSDNDLKQAFKAAPPGALVISVDTDILFLPEQQKQLAEVLPGATFLNLDSSDGHDGFLLEFTALGNAITKHLRAKLPIIYAHDIVNAEGKVLGETVTNSIFGELESEH